MVSQLSLGTALSKTFSTLLLITRSTRLVEMSMMAGMQKLGCEFASDDELLWASMPVAVEQAPCYPALRSTEATLASDLLPSALRAVFALPEIQRTCFVLRMLASASRECCALLLDRTTDEIDDLTCSAAQSLVQIVASGATEPSVFELISEEVNSSTALSLSY